MTYKIFKNFHRCWPFSFGLFYNKKVINKTIIFKSDCKYDLNNVNQGDINKLFGIGYFWHHTNSARFGWRYNIEKEVIDIFAYCYVNKQKVVKHITWVALNKKINCEILIQNGKYFFNTGSYPRTTVNIPFTHNKKWSYKLGLYFGGNEKAPNKMSIIIK